MEGPLDSRPSTETVFARWLELRDQGAAPDIDELCSAHPELAADLRALHLEWSRHASTPRPAMDSTRPLDETLAGTRRGDFRFVRELGRGGMGIVYEAEQIVTGQRLALKVLPPDLADDPERRTRLEREARLAAQISHPNCVFVYGVFDVDGVPAIALELMPGETLEDRLRAGDAVPIHLAVRWTLDVLDGLEAAAAAGVVHRDVKPSNCFLTPEGRVKLGDFGLSVPHSTDERLTQEGTYIGTPSYSSPEQIRGDDLDVRSDLFAVGGLLYSLLTGRVPFPARTAQEALARILADPPDPVRAHRPDVPRALDRAIRRLLAKSPEKRFKSPVAVRRQLERFALNLEASSVAARVGAGVATFFVVWITLSLLMLASERTNVVPEWVYGLTAITLLSLQVPLWARLAPLFGFRVLTYGHRRPRENRPSGTGQDSGATSRRRAEGVAESEEAVQEFPFERHRHLHRRRDRRLGRQVLVLDTPAPYGHDVWSTPGRPMPLRLLSRLRTDHGTRLVFEDPGGHPLLADDRTNGPLDWPWIRRALIDLAVELQWRGHGIALERLWLDGRDRLRVIDDSTQPSDQPGPAAAIETFAQVARRLLGAASQRLGPWQAVVPLRADSKLVPLVDGRLEDRDIESVRVALAGMASLPALTRGRRLCFAIAAYLIVAYVCGLVLFALSALAQRESLDEGFQQTGLPFGIILPIFGLISFLSRGGLALRVSGYGLRGDDGTPASRFRCALRTLIAVAPLWPLHIVTSSATFTQLSLATKLGWTVVSLTIFIGLFVHIYRSPDRALHDRFAGTWVVPR